ncbi:MAG: pyridoxal kinase PdxY [Alphaproteobacteria bacterium]
MNVLSIQSGVAYGHVGNSTAQFCLQRMGHEAWRIDTVRFSNHPGHGGFAGAVTEAAEIDDLVAALDARGWLAGCDALLSGYLGAADQGPALLGAATRLRAANPRALWLLDPVIGDDGRVFVKPGIPEFMRDAAVPVADILTPNAFELSWLSGMPVHDIATAAAAARRLRGARGTTVLATGIRAGDGAIATLALHGGGIHVVETPRVDMPANGTGDSFAALFLGRFLATRDVADALGHAASATCALLRATAARGERELALVAAQDALVAPEPRYDARALPA